MQPYLRFRLHLLANDSGGSVDGDRPRSSPNDERDAPGPTLTGPLLRRVVGKALVDRFCPFGRPLCEERPPPGPRARVAGDGEPSSGRAAPGAPVGGPSRAAAHTAGRPLGPVDLCRLAETCPYGVLFAASLTPRPPYALFVPPGAENGAAGSVELTLFGSAWRLYPWALGALATALRNGVGKKRRSWRVKAVLRVPPGQPPEPLATSGLARLPPDLAPDLLNLALEPYLAPQPVTVLFLSPARLLRDGRLLPGREPVPFELLIARILDRFAGLYGSEASEVLRPEIRAAIEAEAARVPVVEDGTRWLEVRDYSARSRSELLLGGKVGRTTYGEGAARFLPILRAGEALHVGKNAASGCGRIQVDLPPPVPAP